MGTGLPELAGRCRRLAGEDEAALAELVALMTDDDDPAVVTTLDGAVRVLLESTARLLMNELWDEGSLTGAGAGIAQAMLTFRQCVVLLELWCTETQRLLRPGEAEATALALVLRRTAMHTLGAAGQRIIDDVQESSSIDFLTGLPTRRTAEAKLSRMCETRGESRFSLVIADLDDLKLINDTQGYPNGDEALRGLATSLRDIAVEGATAYRWSAGDEFCVILPDLDGSEADAVLRAVQDAPVKFSYGQSCYPDEADSQNELWSLAEGRLKVQKRDRKAGRDLGTGVLLQRDYSGRTTPPPHLAKPIVDPAPESYH